MPGGIQAAIGNLFENSRAQALPAFQDAGIDLLERGALIPGCSAVISFSV
jgi:hypothetical protein